MGKKSIISIIIIIVVAISVSMLIFALYPQRSNINVGYHYDYRVSIASDSNEEYVLEVPVVIYSQNQKGLEPTKLEYLSATVFRGISSIRVLSGNGSIKQNMTQLGPSLRTTGVGNTMIGFSLVENKRPDDYNEPTRLSLSMGNYTDQLTKRPDKYYLWRSGGGQSISIKIELNITWAFSKTSAGNIQMHINTTLVEPSWHEVNATIKAIYL